MNAAITVLRTRGKGIVTVDRALEDTMVTPTAVSRYLSDLSFPATKQELVEHAEDNSAPEDVIAALDSIPDDLYDSLAEVWAVVGAASQ